MALRAERFAKPIETRWERIRLWLNMIFVDHGLFRMIYLNKHAVGRNAWRAAQPTPYQIRRFARDGGKTVVNLRGGREFGSHPLEVEACAKAGLALRHFTLRSRDLPTVDELKAVSALFNEIEYPVLFHCKSGADRAGLMSALYLLLHEGRPPEEAQAQLHYRFGHFRQGKTGVLDAFLAHYAADWRETGAGLLEWAENRYDPQAIKAGFKRGFWSDLVVDRVLRRE